MSSRGAFLAATAVVAAGSGMPRRGRAATVDFDRAAFESRVQEPYRHRQAFAASQVADGAVLGFMFNSLNAYEAGFGEGPGTLHAAAVLYHTGVALALDDAAWRSWRIGEVIRQTGDRVAAAVDDGNPFVRGPAGWTFAELGRRGASFFVCRNALGDLARRTGTSIDDLAAHLLPDMLIVPAGVATINALQEERFTLFVATG